MKKIFTLFVFFIFAQSVQATVIEAGVSIEHVPKALFGSWRVNAKLDKTNSPASFRPQSIDFWNLSRIDNTITLENPFSGANAEISVQTVEGNLIVFSKKLPYQGNKVLTDTVTLRIDENKFSGINTLKLESFSLIDNHLIKSETATYHITGEKISGENVLTEENLDNASF
jgi:hypothetical protein